MLMLQNAMIYNAKDSAVYMMSSTLKQFVLKVRFVGIKLHII